MGIERRAPAGLIPVTFQTISLSNSTAVGLNSTVRASAAVLDISVETNQVRYRADGSAPTKTTGVLMDIGGPYRFEGFNGTSLLKFQRSTGTAKVSVMAYKYPGDNSRA